MLGTEDFKAPEHDAVEHDDKPVEICTTMSGSWGYSEDRDGEHMREEEVRETLEDARNDDCNLLLNTGPLPDGRIHPEDQKTLRAAGQRLQRESFPGE